MHTCYIMVSLHHKVAPDLFGGRLELVRRRPKQLLLLGNQFSLGESTELQLGVLLLARLADVSSGHINKGQRTACCVLCS